MENTKQHRVRKLKLLEEKFEHSGRKGAILDFVQNSGVQFHIYKYLKISPFESWKEAERILEGFWWDLRKSLCWESCKVSDESHERFLEIIVIILESFRKES